MLSGLGRLREVSRHHPANTRSHEAISIRHHSRETRAIQFRYPLTRTRPVQEQVAAEASGDRIVIEDVYLQ